MKTLLLFLSFALLLVNSIFPQGSTDPIKNAPGIPILTYIGDEMRWIQDASFYKKMDSAGIFGTEVVNMVQSYYTNYFQGTNLKIIPNNADGSEYNYINRYTDAYYSVWEAEGTPSGNGDATLDYNKNIGEIYNGAVRTKVGAANDTLIYGPYYEQEIKYAMVNNEDTIFYRADFKLKKEDVNPQMSPGTNDTICIIQVTASHVSESLPLYIDSTYIIDQKIILYHQLADTFNTFSLNYNLFIDSLFTSDTTKFRAWAYYIQYKVLWKGNSNLVRLYVDKIILTDERGRKIRDFYTDVENELRFQIANDFNSNYSGRITGWLGLDEPWSIDQFEPIRVVQNIIDTHGQGKELWLASGTGYNGRWGSNVPVGQINPIGSYKLFTFDEFHKRVGKANTWMDYYLYIFPDATFGADYRDTRIKYMADTVWGRFYNKQNVFWGASVQAGKYHEPNSWIGLREIDGKDLLYNVNIALLAGAKLISFWKYSANITIGTPIGHTALVNVYWPSIDRTTPPSYYEYTDKWYKLRDTIAPRLNGLMGKTLKNLKHLKHYLSINALVQPENSPACDYVDFIKATGGSNDTCLVELGFFENPLDLSKRFFMLVNRYYSSLHSMRIGLRYLSDYNNWNVKDYIDTTSFTLIQNNQKSEFTADIYPGDAKLYSVSPVIKYGGNLIADETISAPTTLHEDMTIESGATMYVNSQYTANANIIVKNGGKIVGGSDGQIVFANGKQLIIEGNVQINGTANNHLKLFYEPTTDVGIKVKRGAELNISHCDVMESVVGISTEPNFQSITIEDVNIVDCLDSGIGLIGPANRHSEATPEIKNCKIMHCGIGISAANIPELVIMQDSIMDCGLGIYISQVSSVFILENKIVNTNTAELPGIFMLSSNGNISGNIIRGHTDGIYLAYSSPNIGMNTISRNKYHGIYAGVGSIPNLSQQLVGVPPNIVAVMGMNEISENGNPGLGADGTYDDGSEIYLYRSYITLKNGCNTIMDDRPSTPSLSTTLLMNGIVKDQIEIDARGNVWGNIIPTSSRFGRLQVIFEPYQVHSCVSPQNPCSEIELKTSDKKIIDTLPAVSCEVSQLADLETMYAEAEKEYLSGGIDEAAEKYRQIIQAEYTTEEKLDAFNKLYNIGNILDTTNNYFTELHNIFNNLAQTIGDTTLMYIFQQNAILCKVSKEEYLSAIGDFDQIIQQAPESERAAIAEIDIMTTALLLDTTNNQLGKVAGGKYLVKGSGDYITRMSEIMKNKFGGGKKSAKQMIPTEYSLSQNYPNPFNPVTKIKYSIPCAGAQCIVPVQIKVYDILGREIATLVNEEKPAGHYEVELDASKLSSGCYFYQIVTKDFIKTMKMLMLK